MKHSQNHSKVRVLTINILTPHLGHEWVYDFHSINPWCEQPPFLLKPSFELSVLQSYLSSPLSFLFQHRPIIYLLVFISLFCIFLSFFLVLYCYCYFLNIICYLLFKYILYVYIYIYYYYYDIELRNSVRQLAHFLELEAQKSDQSL